ncbi:MAG TPA: alpha/beta fold hydrolase, partial [Polyangiales bacterium]
ADLALRFAARYPERVSGVVGLSGALNLFAASETSFQRNMRKLARSAARDIEHAHLYHQLLFGAGCGHYGALVAERGDEAMLANMVSALDPALLHLTSAPFRDPHTLHAYAKAMRAHYRDAENALLAQIAAPALFITGLRDEVAHPDASRVAAAQLPSAQLVELPEADHFALYTEPQVATLIRSFAESAPAPSTVRIQAA